VINFHDWPRSRAEQYIECFAIVTDRVKPYRDTLTKQIHEADYWKFWDKRLANYEQIQRRERVLVLSFVTKHVSFAFVPTNQIFSNKVLVFTDCDHEAFAVLQSSIHVLWCWRFSPRNLSLLAYSPKSCFESFPFPGKGDYVEGRWRYAPLREVGQLYEINRGEMMRDACTGLTELYNRFHDAVQSDTDIRRLRELHAALDRAVLEAYGWGDLAARAEPRFLDAESEDDHTYQGRLFWPSDFRDEVLARLLALNADRHAGEVRLGLVKEDVTHAHDEETDKEDFGELI
jgi:hypothetical protein